MVRLAIAAIPGDGIGPEVLEAARAVVERAAAGRGVECAFEQFDWGVANPLAAILSAAMMLDHLDRPAIARAIRDAVAGVLGEGNVRTPDLDGNSSTEETAQAVIAQLPAARPAPHAS